MAHFWCRKISKDHLQQINDKKLQPITNNLNFILVRVIFPHNTLWIFYKQSVVNNIFFFLFPKLFSAASSKSASGFHLTINWNHQMDPTFIPKILYYFLIFCRTFDTYLMLISFVNVETQSVKVTKGFIQTDNSKKWCVGVWQQKKIKYGPANPSLWLTKQEDTYLHSWIELFLWQ